MTRVIKNTTSAKGIVEIIEQVKTEKPSKSLRKHFGVLKRQIDAVEYQKKMRNEWD